MLNSALMIMIMMLGIITVQLTGDVDGGTTAALLLIPTISHPCLIIRQKYNLWR